MSPLPAWNIDLSAYSTPEHPLAGRYVIGKEIGRGASASVFVARDVKHARDVAVKVLRPDLTSTVSAQRFLQEIKIAAALAHPHILPIHDSGAADGLLYYVMPFVPGETLATMLRRTGKLPMEDALRIAREVAGALQFAHDQGVVHRDIKPENILLPGNVAVVADFGLARALEPEAGNERLTATGIGLGTPRYMSPEQAAGDQQVDARADQYSFACVVHEMMAGRTPFDGYSFQKLVAAHVMEVPPRLSTMLPDVPAAIDDALVRALSKMQEDRFPTIAEFMRAMDGGMSRSVAAAAWPSSWWRGRTTRTHRRRVAVAIAVLTVTAAVALGWRVWSARAAGAGDVRNRVVIAPLTALDPSLALWREGLMDILARGLDGTGPLRTVSPTVVLRSWSGRGDRASAIELAHATSAGVSVFGVLTALGSDSVRADVTVLEVEGDTVIGDIEVRESSSRMDRLADTLTMRVLRAIGKTRMVTAVLGGSLNSRSLPALREFLHGEQLYRGNDFGAAKPAYERAVQLDTTFALAYRRLALVLRAANEGDTLATRYSIRAGELNRGMGLRDSLLIVADSLAVGSRSAEFVEVELLQRIRRRLATLDLATRTYPNDPEVWNDLGEARAHSLRAGADAASVLDAFEKALAADSLFGPAYFHAIDLTLAVRGTEPALALTKRYLRINPRDQRFVALAEILGGNRSERDLQAIVKRRGADARTAAFLLARSAADDTTGIKMLRIIGSMESRLASALRMRGRARDAAAVPESVYVATLNGLADYLFVAWYATPLPAGVAARADSMVRARIASEEREAMPLALAWAARRSDATMLKRIGSLARTRSSAAATAAERAAWQFIAGGSNAYLAAARRDTVGAARLFGMLADTLAPLNPTMPMVLDAARVLAAAGNAAAAAKLLDNHPMAPLGISGWTVLWSLERARVAATLGDRARASKLRRYVETMWSHADPALAAELRR